ncbi:GDP-mannose 4,6-dehydratase [Paenibacillus algorifonticola]|uniref:GDP-mannose 4,6-dehydratase n=1 Tax=Paenibacillus algorifonticola TaxID=684063 RepID=UPI003D290E34
MKALITGITGFAGSHLAEYLLAHQMEVSGTVRKTSSIKHIAHLLPAVRLYECELTNEADVEKMIADVKPDMIFHLAAQSFVPKSWESPLATIYNNIAGQIHLLEAVRKAGINCKLLIACSSEEYGQVDKQDIPIKETTPLRPLSPYAVSKITQNYLGYQYYRSYGMHIVCMRTFNHTGPRRGEQFVTSNFAKQIVEIERGLKTPVLYVGNLEAKRDFTDVRDVVRAYHLAIEKCEPGEVYNIASGSSRAIGEMLQTLVGLSSSTISIQEDPARLRPADVPELIGDYSKFHHRTGWRPEIPFEQTMQDLLSYWRAELG